MSYLTLNGLDQNDFIGNVSWFDHFTKYSVDSGWNMNLSTLVLKNKEMSKSADLKPEMTLELAFQTGYPYIGVPDKTFNILSDKLKDTFTDCTQDD